jgi:hypothetical protein
MSQWTARPVGILRFLTIAGIPFLVSLAAALLFVFWVMGIPGTPTAPYYQGWLIGFMALSLYLVAYGFGLLVLFVLWLLKWPLADLVHGIIWICMISFLIAMGIAVSNLS